MSNPCEPNPYSASRCSGEPRRATKWRRNKVPTIALLPATFGGIVLSGSAFGLILAALTGLTSGNSSSSPLLLLSSGIALGVMISACVGIPVIIVAVCLSAPLVNLAKGWRPEQAIRYAMICGFFSGGSPLFIAALEHPASLLVGMIPGGFGAIGTWLFVRWVFSASRQITSTDPPRTLAE